MDSNYEKQGRQLLDKARKMQKTFGAKLSKFFGSNNAVEDSVEFYEKAMNKFKLGECWREAAETACELAEVHMSLDEKHDAAHTLSEAGKCLAQIKDPNARNHFQASATIYEDEGRFQQAGRQMKECAELLEAAQMYAEAIQAYERAIKYYDADRQTSDKLKCSLKIANLAASMERYPQAISLFEEVAAAYVENNLLKYSAKDVLLMGALCAAAHGTPAELRDKIAYYESIDPSLEDSRQHELLVAIASAGEEGNVEAFTDAVASYDKLKRLDDLQTTLLLKTKGQMTNTGGLGAAAAAAGDEDDDLC